jgi:hypothetical protein
MAVQVGHAILAHHHQVAGGAQERLEIVHRPAATSQSEDERALGIRHERGVGERHLATALALRRFVDDERHGLRLRSGDVHLHRHDLHADAMSGVKS